MRGREFGIWAIAGLFRQAVINDMCHVIYMQSATRHIRSYQHGQLPLPESFQGLDALVLRDFA